MCGGTGITSEYNEDTNSYNHSHCSCNNGFERRFPSNAVMTKKKWNYVIKTACDAWDKRSEK